MKICGEEGDGRVKKFFAVYLVKNARKSDFWGDWWYDGIVRMADLSWINRNMGCIEILDHGAELLGNVAINRNMGCIEIDAALESQNRGKD